MKYQPYQHCTFVSQYKSKHYGNTCCEPAWRLRLPGLATSTHPEQALRMHPHILQHNSSEHSHPLPPESCSRPFRWQMHSSASIINRKSSRATISDCAHQSKLRLWLKVQVDTVAIPGERFSSTEFAKQESSQASPSLGIFLQYPVHITESSWRPTCPFTAL